MFNHRFDQNIDRLDELYRSSFGEVLHLVPFYDGDRRNVFAVHESSYCFQGYFAQAYPRLASLPASHYVFLGDDLILSPRLTRDTLARQLGLDDSTAYLKELIPAGEQTFEWTHLTSVVRTFEPSNRSGYVSYERELPTRQEAEERIARHGLGTQRLSWSNLRGYRDSYRYRVRDFAKGVATLLRYRNAPRYPLLLGYSDFVVVPATSLREFCRLCGVFAAMGLFVEAAVPTALALSCERVVTEAETGCSGRELWSPDEIAELKLRCGNDVEKLRLGLAPDELYVHPVKLSQWSMA